MPPTAMYIERCLSDSEMIGDFSNVDDLEENNLLAKMNV